MYTERCSSISVLTRNGNGSYGTAERQRNGGNQALFATSAANEKKKIKTHTHNMKQPNQILNIHIKSELRITTMLINASFK